MNGKSDISDCIEYQGFINPNGYGSRWYGGKQMLAHRAAMLEAGHDINGRSVLHTCDNRRCINVEHLRLGSQSDNMIDRTMRGPRNRTLRLTPQQAREIRRMLAAGQEGASIARHFDVSQGAIYAIKAGRSWRHLKDEK